jgi:hypothetical protein
VLGGIGSFIASANSSPLHDQDSGDLELQSECLMSDLTELRGETGMPETEATHATRRVFVRE